MVGNLIDLQWSVYPSITRVDVVATCVSVVVQWTYTVAGVHCMWSVIIICPAGTGVVVSCCTIQSYSES